MRKIFCEFCEKELEDDDDYILIDDDDVMVRCLSCREDFDLYRGK